MFKKIDNHLMLSDGVYAFGKKLVQIYIPAISALYFGLGSIWGLPAIEQVVGTFAVLATFIGVCLGLSSNQYDASGAALVELEEATTYDGEIVVEEGKGGKLLYSLELNDDVETIEGKKSITFKVGKPV